MSQTLPIVIVSSLLAGGAGAVAATALTAKPPAPAQASANDSSDAILARLDAIQQMAQDNARRIEEVASKPTLAPVSGGNMRSAALAEGGLTEEEIRALIKDVAEQDLAVPNSAAAATVEAVIEMREERERLEREQAREEQRQKRLEDQLAEMQTKLGLDMSQMNQMRVAMIERDAKGEEMRQAMRDAMQNGGMGDTNVDPRTAWRTLMDDHQAAVQGILTPTQYEQYKEEGYDNPFGGRGGRGGGFGGRGGNAGGGNTGGGAAGGGNGGGRGGRGGF